MPHSPETWAANVLSSKSVMVSFLICLQIYILRSQVRLLHVRAIRLYTVKQALEKDVHGSTTDKILPAVQQINNNLFFPDSSFGAR